MDTCMPPLPPPSSHHLPATLPHLYAHLPPQIQIRPTGYVDRVFHASRKKRNHTELVVCRHPPEAACGACPMRGLPMRSGLTAGEPCHCDEAIGILVNIEGPQRCAIHLPTPWLHTTLTRSVCISPSMRRQNCGRLRATPCKAAKDNWLGRSQGSLTPMTSL